MRRAAAIDSVKSSPTAASNRKNKAHCGAQYAMACALAGVAFVLGL